MQIIPLLEQRMRLGESIIWDDKSHVLYWVDVGYPSKIWRFDEARKTSHSIPYDGLIGCVALTHIDDTLLVLTSDGLKLCHFPSGRIEHFLDVEPEFPTNICNDCGVDDRGRLWFGTMEKFHIDRHRKAIIYGTLIGVTGCGGTVLLFKVLTIGPAYLVFPIIALSPTITVLLSFALLRERTGKLGALGIVLAIISVLFFSVQDPQKGEFGHGWLLMSLVITVAWGVQAYYMKVASQHMSSASICFYNTLAALAFIPLTLWMTNFHQTINWGWSGVGAATVIQLLNAIGFCTFVFAFR